MLAAISIAALSFAPGLAPMAATRHTNAVVMSSARDQFCYGGADHQGIVIGIKGGRGHGKKEEKVSPPPALLSDEDEFKFGCRRTVVGYMGGTTLGFDHAMHSSLPQAPMRAALEVAANEEVKAEKEEVAEPVEIEDEAVEAEDQEMVAA